MITAQDLLLVGFLVFLEGILSIDNALVLAMLARHLPPAEQKKALTYGLVGAVVFRLLALAAATYLIQWRWVKFAGGGYLLYIGLKGLLAPAREGEDPTRSPISFWKTVVLIELMDIAFAVDSILAAVALTPKFWIVFTGGILGVIMMRGAASIFLKLLARFPELETTAYLLVTLIGVKVSLEAFRFPWANFHSSEEPAFWVFWSLMFGCVLYGFKKPRAPSS